ncbi:MAG TPA: tyrosine-type recombinase/integrase [Anaerolineales bacterium]|nr:tyrosine-type recombinase/integrase [Anaerolineales bacterium]
MQVNASQNSTPNPGIYRTDELQPWISAFFHACRARNLAIGTIEFYNKKLRAFTDFCLENHADRIGGIKADLIRNFMIMLAEAGHRPAGVHCYYRAIKTFLKWYEREAEPEDWRNPINKVKPPIIPLEPLDPVSIDTIKSLLATCKRGTLVDARDSASLLLLLDTGVRLAEFLALNIGDVDPITGAILVRSGKGRKPRNVYLGEKSRQTLRRYMKKREDHNPALWVSKFGERLSETGLRMMLRRRAAQAGVPAPSPHDFRRAFAIERWRAGVDILTISRLMGHTSLQVMNRYLKQIGADLEQVSRRSSPVDLNF